MISFSNQNRIMFLYVVKTMLGDSIQTIWRQMDLIRNVMSFNSIGATGVYNSNATKDPKGIVSLPGFNLKDITRPMLKKLAAVSPGATLNLIEV